MTDQTPERDEKVCRRCGGAGETLAYDVCPECDGDGVTVQSQSKQGRKGWVLADREGLLHLPLRDNDEDAWWTPIACGGGISLPGSQERGTPTCPICKQEEGRA